MDLFVANNQFRPEKIIDQYESILWTERYTAHGDFTLVVKQDYFSRNLLNKQYLLSSKSSRVMQIETFDYQEQTDGPDLVKVTGRSFEAFLSQRSSRSDAGKDPEPFSGNAADVMAFIVEKYCINPSTAGAVNVIPNLSTSWYPLGNDISVMVDRGDIYSIIKNLADALKIGFRIDVDRDSNGLVFRPYTGLDLSDPTTSYYLEFSVDNENLFNVKTIESVANYKNHARVFGKKASVDVYSPGVSSSVSGLNRRTIVIEADDIGSAPDATEDITTIAQDQAMLKQRGLETLALIDNRYVKLIDGDVKQILPGEYPWSLGDIVMVQDTYGNRNVMMITETIRSVDTESGEKLTPTFELIK